MGFSTKHIFFLKFFGCTLSFKKGCVLLFFLYPGDAGAQGVELVLQVLVAPVDVLDAPDLGLAGGGEPGHDQRRPGPQVAPRTRAVRLLTLMEAPILRSSFTWLNRLSKMFSTTTELLLAVVR